MVVVAGCVVGVVDDGGGKLCCWWLASGGMVRLGLDGGYVGFLVCSRWRERKGEEERQKLERAERWYWNILLCKYNTLMCYIGK